jgi:hypothetical protein
MALYKGNGEKLETTVSSEDIKKALMGAIADGSVNMGSQIGATLAYTSPGAAWETNANAAYQSLLMAYKAKPNQSIPFFISTDQHGRGLEQHRWLNNTDKDGMEMASINLGDTVIDVFNMTEFANQLARTQQVKNYIGVAGNHEYKHGSEIMSDYEVCRVYNTTDYDRMMNPSPADNFVVIDGLHCVKYVVVSEYVLNADGMDYTHGMTAETAEWLIRELTANDGYDIVLLKHWFLKLADGGTYKKRDGTSIADTTAAYLPELTALFTARKNKTSGSYTDVDGVSHAYDFTNCKHELLCALHGHEHLEVYGNAGGLLCYCADMYNDNRTCTFGLIDRENSTMTVWVFDKTGVREPYTMNI